MFKNTKSSKKTVPIDYTKRGFTEIKEELKGYIKRYYPDTYKDFNQSSFGSMMLDLVSYIGDQLHYYIDHNANEANPMFAKESENVMGHLGPYGLKIRKSNSAEVVNVYIPFPGKTNGVGIDESYRMVLSKDSEYQTQGGNSFTQTADVVVDALTADVIGHRTNEDGSKLSYYLLKVPVPVKSGKIKEFSVEVGDARKFLKIEIPDSDITEIISIKDSEGNLYTEVDNLSNDVVLTPIIDRASLATKTGEIKTRMKSVPVPRRFIVEQGINRTFVVFGYGSDSDLSTNSLVDPSRPLLKVEGKQNISTPKQNPYNVFTSNALGIAPQNTTLTITYRSNTSTNTNAAVGTLNQVVSPVIKFLNEERLDVTKLDYIRENVEVYNENPINGFVSVPNTEELKRRYLGNYSAQGRAVTMNDYVSSVYSMPTGFGSIKRAGIVRDTNDLRRNLNMYLISEGADGKLQKPSMLLKQNVKTWLNSVRMISDSIDLFDANIINFGLDIKVQAAPGVSTQVLLDTIKRKLYEELMTVMPDIGESFSISEVFAILRAIPEIVRVPQRDGVSIRSLSGGTYTDYFYDIPANMSLDESLIQIPDNSIWEIKYLDDIRGTIIN